jgi:hypothetical protein
MKTISFALFAWCVFTSSHFPFARALTSDGRFVVVQLGDSFASGNGARGPNGTVNYAGIPDCFRSPTTWGAQATAALPQSKGGLSAVYVTRACYGGVLKDVTNPRIFSTRFTTKTNGVCSASPALPYAPEKYYVKKQPITFCIVHQCPPATISRCHQGNGRRAPCHWWK